MARDLEHEQAIREARGALTKQWRSAPPRPSIRYGSIADRAQQLARRNAWDKRKPGQWERR